MPLVLYTRRPFANQLTFHLGQPVPAVPSNQSAAMRGTLRLFASVKPVRYLQPGAPTGLTGLLTNPTPRSTLLYLYHKTLDKLADIPETSLYRQSVEAVTKHRLGLVQGVKPAGYDEWAAKTRAVIEQNPDEFNAGHKAKQPGDKGYKSPTGKYIAERQWSFLEGLSLDGKQYYLRPIPMEPGDERLEDAEDYEMFEHQGKSDAEEASSNALASSERYKISQEVGDLNKLVKEGKAEVAPAEEKQQGEIILDAEPQLTVDQ